MNHHVRNAVLAIGIAVWGAASGGASEFLGIVGDVGRLASTYAWSVDSSGEVVVGSSDSDDSGHRAFRWTAAGGTQFLDDTLMAPGISGNRRVVVGQVQNYASGIVEPLRWMAADDAQFLGGAPEATLDSRTIPLDVSFNGDVIVGQTRVGARSGAFRPRDE